MDEEKRPAVGTVAEVIGAFGKLGLTSFGGPIAHLGYFRAEFVLRRRWIDEHDYADLVALCQFLPGPTSSQVGFALGLRRAGAPGAFAAFVAFTLPSAVLLVLFALYAPTGESALFSGFLDGLKIVAVAVVAHAVYGMAPALCPDKPRAAIAVFAVASTALLPNALGQGVAIAAGAAAGLFLTLPARTARSAPKPAFPRLKRWIGLASFVCFGLLFAASPLIAGLGGFRAQLFDAFYHAGALVFGGGHVVLPLLEAQTVARGWIDADTFLAGYGAAQAVPGPLFTFAAFLGAASTPAPGALVNATIATVAIFLPGFLLLLAALPHWDDLLHRPLALNAMNGANAAVVGVLAAALFDPLLVGVLGSRADFLLALAGFLLLARWQAPPWLVVLLLTVSGAIFAHL